MNFKLCPKCRAVIDNADKVALLEHYAFKDVLHFTQYDGWIDYPPGDCVMTPDEEGDVVMSTSAWELRSGVPVRVHILDGTETKDAIRILQKMILWMADCSPDQSCKEMRPSEYAGVGLDDGLPF